MTANWPLRSGARILREFAALWVAAVAMLFSVGCSTPAYTELEPISGEIASPTGAYSILPMLGGWSRTAEGRSMFPDGDLVLSHAEIGVMAIIFFARGTADSLDAVVANRHQLIRDSYEILAFEERRRFHTHSKFTPISLSTYAVRDFSSNERAVFVSGSVRGPAAIVEILAIGGEYPQNVMLLEDLVAGLRFADSKEDSP